MTAVRKTFPFVTKYVQTPLLAAMMRYIKCVLQRRKASQVTAPVTLKRSRTTCEYHNLIARGCCPGNILGYKLLQANKISIHQRWNGRIQSCTSMINPGEPRCHIYMNELKDLKRRILNAGHTPGVFIAKLLYSNGWTWPDNLEQIQQAVHIMEAAADIQLKASTALAKLESQIQTGFRVLQTISEIEKVLQSFKGTKQHLEKQLKDASEQKAKLHDEFITLT